MKLKELKEHLAATASSRVRFVLPNGDWIAPHAHVTEVARLDKQFVDCGGTFRVDSVCRLQTWVADDLSHRLTAGKLLGILNKARGFLKTDDIEVDVEHELEFVSQFPLERVEVAEGELIMHVTTRHTACLAMEKCLPAASNPSAIFFKPLPILTPKKQS
jgi:hypothetical protein